MQADRDTSATDRQIALGMEYKGLLECAADYQQLYDQLHHGTPGLVKDGNEYVAELFYGWSPWTSITLRSNLQYFLYPGGTRENNYAFVIGLKSSIAFRLVTLRVEPLRVGESTCLGQVWQRRIRTFKRLYGRLVGP